MKTNLIQINQKELSQIKSEYSALGYAPSDLEVANQYWNRCVKGVDRLNIVRATGGRTVLQQIRSAVKFIAAEIRLQNA